MLLFDSIVLITVALWAIALAAHRLAPRPNKLVLALLTLAVVAHLAVEGFRWQMVPAYLSVTIAFLVQDGTRHRALDITAITFVGFFVVASLATSIAFPLFALPTPTGGHGIATTDQHVIDTHREETYTPKPGDPRQLMLKVWHPTTSRDGAMAPYWHEPLRRSRAVTSMTPLPSFTFAHLGLVETNSLENAAISTQGPYPILLYSHGVGIGWAGGITILAEELASHGYIVVSINHAFIGSMSIFPDGRLVPFDAATALAMSTPPPQELIAMQNELRASRDGEVQVALYGEGMALMPAGILGPITHALDVQAADLRFILDQLETWQQTGTGPSWAHAADLDRIGVFGNSLGGSATFEVCRDDVRCRAGVNIDGFHPRQIEVGQDSAPFLYFNAAENLLFTTNVRHSTAPARVVLVDDVTHFNFFDFAVMSPLYQALGVLGPIDGRLGLEVLGHHVRVFFDTHLKGHARLPRDYVGVEVDDIHNRPGTISE